MDYRIPVVPLSAVEQQNTHREDKVKKLIEMFENHPNKESFLQDFKQTKEINEFSEKSQDLIADINNTKIFELCEKSSKQQCLEFNLYWEASIVSCTCGRYLRISRSDKEVDKGNNDIVSIPNITRIKKCYIKRAKRNMEDTHSFLRSDTATTCTEIR